MTQTQLKFNFSVKEALAVIREMEEREKCFEQEKRLAEREFKKFARRMDAAGEPNGEKGELSALAEDFEFYDDDDDVVGDGLVRFFIRPWANPWGVPEAAAAGFREWLRPGTVVTLRGIDVGDQSGTLVFATAGFRTGEEEKIENFHSDRHGRRTDRRGRTN